MIPLRFFVALVTSALLGACVSPQSKLDGAAIDHHQRIQGKASNQAGGTSFPIAAPPRCDVDMRTQEERDLETIGRKP